MSNIGDVTSRVLLDTTNFDAGSKKVQATVDATARAQERAAERARVAWQKEEVAQDRAAQKAEAASRAKELAALKADILARSQDAEAEASARSAAALSRLTQNLNAYAGVSSRAAAANAELAQSYGGAASGGSHLTDSTRAISGAFMELEGRIPIRALERFLSTTESLAPVLAGAFQVVGIVAVGAAIYEMGEKAYHAYQNIVNLRGAIDGLNKAQITVDKAVESANDATESKIEDILEKTQGKSAALQQKLKYDSGKGVDLSSYFYSSEVAKLPDDVKGNYESLYKSVAPADVPARLQKITAEVSNLKRALAFNKEGAFGEAITTVGDFGKDGSRDPVAYMQARLTLAKQIQAQLSAESDKRTSGLQATQTDVGAAQKTEQDKAARKAEEAARKQAEAISKAEQAKFKAMELGRQKEVDEGKLGAQADLNYYEARIGALTKGSDQYKSVLAKIDADKASLGRSNDEYRAIQTHGDEVAAKNTESLAMGGIQLDLASHKITQLTADQRMAAIQTQEYTDKIAALDAQMAALKADPSIAPEVKRNQGANLQNQINALLGEQNTSEVQSQIRQQQAVDAASEAIRRQRDLVAQLTEVEEKNADAMAQMVNSHEVATGAISKNDAAYRAATLHASEYAAQIAKIKQDEADAISDQKLTPEQRQEVLGKLQIQMTDVQGQADRTSQQDQWNEFTTTGLGGAVTALQKFIAAANDTSAQLESIVGSSLKGINDVLLKEIGTRNYNGVDFRRDLRNYGAGEARSVAGVGLEKGEAALMNPALKALGLDSKTKPTGSSSSPFYVRVMNAITGHGNGASAPSSPAAQAASTVARSVNPDVNNFLNTRALPAPTLNIPSGSLSGAAMSTQALGQMLYPNGVSDSSTSAAAAMQPSMSMSPTQLNQMLYPNGAADASSVSAVPQASSDALSFVNGPPQQPGSTTSAVIPAPTWARILGGAINTAAGVGLKMAAFADGTPPLGSDTMAMVGERGPEILNLKAGTSVTPNGQWQKQLGGGAATHNWNIDARGSNDPAAVRAQVMQGIQEAAPHIIAASAQHVTDIRKRAPASRG